MRFFYNIGIEAMVLGIRIAMPFSRKARLWCRGRKGVFRDMASRIDPSVPTAWFHAASLGEFEQGRPVIDAFRKAYPAYKILITFFSPSGYEVRKDFAGADYVFYLPADTPRNVRQFLRIVRPRVAMFIKYEFWANYLRLLRKSDARVYIISAIFRKDSVFFKPWGSFYRRLPDCFDQIFVQDKESVGLLEKIGIRNVTVAGDTRFDRVYSIASQAREIPEIAAFAASGGKVLVAGSTWPPDEELLLELAHKYTDLKFIIAPHEIESERIDRFIAAARRPALRYSQLTPESDLAGAGILFIDTIGMLSSVYGYGHLAYIGGGFGAGIHNILEAATYGLPLVFGPNYE
ncbi:MAG: 3-deoxy-D-manno-octulosonic acid transferase, partial [Rikenellaceae bacterium]|nr:3-deoxy-D-manno-octulosonic acid transferase [Rikenellaceae bacterium]